MDIKNVIPQVVRYFFVGGFAAFTDLVIFYFFAEKLGYNYLLITIVGFLIATLVNYLLSVKFVFESGARFVRGAEIALTYIVSSVALLVHITVLYTFVDLLNFEKMLSKLVAIGSAFMFNFLLRKYYVFKKNTDEA